MCASQSLRKVSRAHCGAPNRLCLPVILYPVDTSPRGPRFDLPAPRWLASSRTHMGCDGVCLEYLVPLLHTHSHHSSLQLLTPGLSQFPASPGSSRSSLVMEGARLNAARYELGTLALPARGPCGCQGRPRPFHRLFSLSHSHFAV
jgi:hypothetical protein